MKKSIFSLLIASLFTFIAANASFAAKVECTVDSVNADQVTMTCEKGKASALAAGEKVKVETKKTKGTFDDGC